MNKNVKFPYKNMLFYYQQIPFHMYILKNGSKTIKIEKKSFVLAQNISWINKQKRINIV